MITVAGDCARWTFPANPCAVHTARVRVHDQLGRWRLDDLIDVTMLLVSELVTNSLRYTAGPIGVRIARRARGPAALLVEVSDPLPELPCAREATADDEGGRGLRLVADSTSRWGTRRSSCGKTVWFELSLPG